MSKDEFLRHLSETGFRAMMTGAIPTVYTEDPGDVKKVKKEAKSCGYDYSFAVKLGKSMPQALLQS